MPSTEETARLQRTLTIELIRRRRLNSPAVWFRPNGDSPNADDALADSLEIDLEAWDGPEHNLGVRLQDGHLELIIKAGDDAFANAFFLAAEHLRIDARFAFGVDRVSSVILKIEEPELIDVWAPKWPRGFKDKHGHWTETKVATSTPKTNKAAAIYRYSKPLPGSITHDGPVVWRPKGKAAALDVDLGVEDLEPRALEPTGMDALIRALAYATLAYWVRTYLDGLTDWDAALTRILGGWIARCEVEGRGINAKGKSLEGICWAPIDTREQALDLIAFLGKLGASADLKVAYFHGESQLIRDPLAPVAGWTALQSLFNADGMLGVRRAFRAGLDLDIVERMSFRYVFDQSTGTYLDRDSLLKGVAYERKPELLVYTHDNEGIFVGKKRMNPFRLYATSSLRTDVRKADMHPGAEPAAILRYSPVYGLLKADETQPDEYKVFNTYRGFVIKPTGVIDPGLMGKILTALDTLLGLLTKDNHGQMLWLKKFIAWTIQHPEIKQQIAPVIIGGQGIGKSYFGTYLMEALFGELAATARSGSLDDNNFSITPFINKLMVFIDEVKLESVGSINEIKQLIRNTKMSGEVKFEDQRDYLIYSRLILASNHFKIGLNSEDSDDRALFYITAWDAQSKNMTDPEFKAWAIGLKPFFDDFHAMLQSVAVRQHLMRYFRDLECTRAELEDQTLSSGNDPRVVTATMSKARKVARAIVGSSYIVKDKEITMWFNMENLSDAIVRVDGKKSRIEPWSIMEEFKRADVVESMGNDHWRFRWNYGRLLQKFGEAHGVAIPASRPTGPGDFEDNDVQSIFGAPQWRGKKVKDGDTRSRPFNPGVDHLDDFE